MYIFVVIIFNLIFNSLNYKIMNPVQGSGYDIQCGTQKIVQNSNPSIIISPQLSQIVQFTFKYPYSIAPKALTATTKFQSASNLLNILFVGYYIVNTATPTSMTLEISTTTPIYTMQLRYMAINADFPYHINVYNNDLSSYAGPSTFNNIVSSTYFANYTKQASQYLFNTFTPVSPGDYSNNKILLFLSCLSYIGTLQAPPNYFPPQINVLTHPINSSHYKVSIDVGTKGKVTKLHFNMLIFDQANLENEGLHWPQYIRANFTDIQGGFMPVPQQYWNATIFGFTDFSGNSTQNYICFSLFLSSQNGKQGIFMLPPQPKNLSNIPIQRFGMTLFYLQSLICTQPSYYLNIKTKLCYELQIFKEGCNGFFIKIPKSNYTNKDIHILNQGVQITSVKQNGEDVQVHCIYKKNILTQKIRVKFPTRQIIDINFNPYTPLIYYSQSQCQVLDNIQILTKTQIGISYFILLLSLFSGKIVGLQLFGILQLAYFSLLSHDFLNLYLSPLINFKIFNGLNINLFTQNSILPKSISQLKLQSNFLNNCNIMLFVFFAFLIISSKLLSFNENVHTNINQSSYFYPCFYLTNFDRLMHFTVTECFNL